MGSEDIELSHKILKILMRVFNQRRELLNNIRNIIMITNNEDLESYKVTQIKNDPLRLQSNR